MDLNLTVPCISESCIEIKIKLIFFHISLRFSRHHTEVWKEKFNLIFVFARDWDGKG